MDKNYNVFMEEIKYAFIGNYHSVNTGSLPVSFQFYLHLLNDGKFPLIASTKQNKIVRIWQYIRLLLSNYDILFVDVFSGRAYFVALISVIIAKIRRKKSWATFHGGGLPLFLNRYNLVNSISLFDGLLTPSKYLISEFKPYKEKFIYLANPIELERFPFKIKQNPNIQSRINFIWIRAFEDVYSPEVSIKTMRILKDKGFDISLKMIGPDLGLIDNCKSLIRNLGLESEVEILGPIPNDKLINYLNEASIFLSTSNLESFGVSIMEAALSGTAIIAYSTGEIPLFWTEDEILMVDSNNEVCFCEAIDKLITLDDYDKRVRLARIKVQSFEMKLIFEKWKNIVNHTILN